MENSPSHQELWTAIRECHDETMEDYTWLDQALRTLEIHPSRMLLFEIKDNLAPRIGRIIGTCDETRNSEDIASDELKKKNLRPTFWPLCLDFYNPQLL